MKFKLALLLAIFIAFPALAQPVTLFGNGTPHTPVDSDTSPVTLGIQFSSSQTGTIAGVRFYRAAKSNSGYSAAVFDGASGARLAFTSVSSEPCRSMPCWELLNFSAPLSIAANKTYIAVYFVKGGHYAGDVQGLANKVTSGPLTAPGSSSIAGGNGVYAYGSSLLRPNSTYQASNYWVDVSFTPSAPPPPNLMVSFNPTNPSIPDSSTVGTFVDTVTASWSDSSPFTGTLGFAQPYSNDAGRFSLSGNNLLVAASLSGTGGTTQNVTVQATQMAATATKNLPIIVTSPAALVALASPANPSEPCAASPGTLVSTLSTTGGNGNSVTWSAVGDTTDFALSGASIIVGPSGIASANCGQANTVTVTASQSGGASSQPLNVPISVAAAVGNFSLLPEDRDFRANWQMAGLLSVGGIPNRTAVCATLSPSGGDDSGPIQNAINSCPTNGVVQLNAGTFNVNNDCISINKSIVVRGVGQSTILSVTNGAQLGNPNSGAHGACVVAIGGDGFSPNSTTLSTDAAQGSYTVTVASTTGIAPGSLVLVDELALAQSMPDCCFNNGTGRVWAEPDYRVEWNAHSPEVGFFDSADFSNDNNFTTAFAGGDACAYSARCGGVNEELHLVTAVSGNTVTFDSPLTLSYRTANNAKVFAYDMSTVVTNAGLENVKVQGGDQGNIVFGACIYCWATGNESTVWINRGGIYFGRAAFRDQADGNWVHDAAWPVNGGGGYAVNLTFGASETLFQNNIVMKANKVVVVRASGSGSVFGYNYMDDGYINGQTGWIETGINCSHLVGSHGCLWEGNYTWNSDSDFTHGNSTHSVYFRNWMTGFRAPFTALDGSHVDDSMGCCGPQRAIADHAYTYWDSFIGNVAGMSGRMSGWTYRCAEGNADLGCAPAVFNLGWNSTSVPGSLADATMSFSYPTTPTGTITSSGCVSSGSNCAPIVDGNFDYLSNAIQWASNDSAHTLPNSLYLSAKPAFFTGASSTWPWVDPIGSTKIFKNPAQARWVAGTPFTQP